MAIVLNDPTWWPTINAYHFYNYFVVAAFVGMTYDWALTFGQEVELIWKHRWSLMTVLYLGVRYLGISYAVLTMLYSVPTISLIDTVSFIMYIVLNWTHIVAYAMLWVMIITRLHAIYQGSRKILIFLIVTSLAVNIFYGVVFITSTMHSSGEKLILSGIYQCQINYVEDSRLLFSIAWILAIVWEVLALCLAVWIAARHFRELRQHSTGGIIEDCLTVLIKTHMVYFASFFVVYCLQLILDLSPLSMDDFLGAQIYSGFLQILTVVQMFVVGPRLILSIREYHAKLVAGSDAATGMTSIAFQERVHISIGSSV